MFSHFDGTCGSDNLRPSNSPASGGSHPLTHNIWNLIHFPTSLVFFSVSQVEVPTGIWWQVLESIHGNILVHQFNPQTCTCTESLLTSSGHFSDLCNSKIICSAICATNLLTFAMDVDETDLATR